VDDPPPKKFNQKCIKQDSETRKMGDLEPYWSVVPYMKKKEKVTREWKEMLNNLYVSWTLLRKSNQEYNRRDMFYMQSLVHS
jgi:hypothetical protein